MARFTVFQTLAAVGIGHERADDIVSKLEARAVAGRRPHLDLREQPPHGSEPQFENGWFASVRDVASHLLRMANKRAVGAGAKHKPVFVDRLLATLVHLRHDATHDVLARWVGVDRSTTTRAIGEASPLLADRGCTIPGIRLRTPA